MPEREKQMLRFLIATSYGPSTVSRYFFALAAELHRRGHEVTVFVDNHTAPPPERYPYPVLVWLSRRPTRLRDFRFLAKRLKQHPVDCIVSNFGSTNVCQIIGRLQSVPARIAWYHTLTEQIDRDHPAPQWLVRLLRLRKSLVYRCATDFVANSKASANDLQAVYRVLAEKCTVLPLLFAPPNTVLQDKQPCLIVCVGRLDESKGQAVLLRAMPLILKAYPDACVEFIGEGTERARYEELAQELGVESTCRFRGSLPLDSVLQRMALAAVCVAPSHSEALGLVNIEAHSVGTPVVASAVGGIKDVVRDGETGFLVPPDCPEAFAEKILSLLQNPKLRTEFGDNARNRFKRHFDLCNIGSHADTLEAITVKRLARRSGSL